MTDPAARSSRVVVVPDKKGTFRIDNQKTAEQCQEEVFRDFERKNPKAAADIKAIRAGAAKLEPKEPVDKRLSEEEQAAQQQAKELFNEVKKSAELKIAKRYPAYNLDVLACIRPLAPSPTKDGNTGKKPPAGTTPSPM